MALKTKENEAELVKDQVTFDDLEFDAEFIDEDEQETTKYYTISGKEQEYHPEWESYGMQDLEVGDRFEGKPEVTIFKKDDKSYNAVRLTLIDSTSEEILTLYFNYPKKDCPYLKRLNKGFDFYRTCFDVIYSILKYRDERNVVKNGEEINHIPTCNIETFMKYLDQHQVVGVRITEGNPESDYDSWMIYKME